MTELKQKMAQRCAQSGKEPQYVTNIGEVKDVLGRSITLSDVKPGDVIRMDLEHLDMKDTWKLSSIRNGLIQDATEHENKLMVIKDIAEINGKYVIETSGAMYSTIDFREEWEAALVREKDEQIGRLLQGAIDERGKWFQPTINNLMEELGIDKTLTDLGIDKKFNKRELYNAVMLCVEERVNEHGMHDIDAIKGIIYSEVENYVMEDAHLTKKAIAEKLHDLNRPVFYFDQQNLWQTDPSTHQSYKELEDTIFNRRPHSQIHFHAPIRPMTSSEMNYSDINGFNSLKLERTIRSEDGSKFYVTDKGVFTSCDLQAEYCEVLKERGDWHPRYEHEKLTPQQYASMLLNGKDSILLELTPGSYNQGERYEFCNKEGYGRNQEIVDTCEMLKKALESGRTIVHIDDRGVGALTPNVVDHNGMEHSTRLHTILPGDNVVLNCSTSYPRDAITGDQLAPIGSELNICPDEIYAIGDYYLMVTNDAIYTNMNEVAELAMGVHLDIQQEKQQELSQNTMDDREL